MIKMMSLYSSGALGVGVGVGGVEVLDGSLVGAELHAAPHQVHVLTAQHAAAAPQPQPQPISEYLTICFISYLYLVFLTLEIR